MHIHFFLHVHAGRCNFNKITPYTAADGFVCIMYFGGEGKTVCRASGKWGTMTHLLLSPDSASRRSQGNHQVRKPLRVGKTSTRRTRRRSTAKTGIPPGRRLWRTPPGRTRYLDARVPSRRCRMAWSLGFIHVRRQRPCKTTDDDAGR